MTDLETNFLLTPENYKKQLFDSYMLSLEKVNSELAQEMRKLSDFAELEVKDVEALEDIIGLARYNSVGGISLDLMLNEGIKDKRKYCSPLQALVWVLYDYDKKYLNKKPWETKIRRKVKPSGLAEFIKYAWITSSESNNYKSDRWENFDEVVDRLHSPLLVQRYITDNIVYDFTKRRKFKSTGIRIYQAPEQTFNTKKGICWDTAVLALHFLLENGYEYSNFETYRDNTACVFSVEQHSPKKDGHMVCLFMQDNAFYRIEAAGIGGPYSTLEEAAAAVLSKNWDYYKIRDINLKVIKTVRQ